MKIIFVEDCGEKFWYVAETTAQVLTKHLKENSDYTCPAHLDDFREMPEDEARKLPFFSENGENLYSLYEAAKRVKQKEYPFLVATTLI